MHSDTAHFLNECHLQPFYGARNIYILTFAPVKVLLRFTSTKIGRLKKRKGEHNSVNDFARTVDDITVANQPQK